MAIGPAGYDGTTISQRVGTGLDGNYCALKFAVAMSLQQELAYTVLIPVVEAADGAALVSDRLDNQH